MDLIEESSILRKIGPWIFQIIAAGILLQTLYFKFTGSPESIYIFETLGVEPWGRIGTGVLELVAGVLLLWYRLAWVGAALGLMVITGALMSHLTILGIEVRGDGGTLFFLAVLVFVSCVIVLVLRRKDIRQDLEAVNIIQAESK